jgi:hypothetical protein
MRNLVTTSVNCDGNTWNILAGSCQTGCGLPDNDLAIAINTAGCSCGTAYILRPGIGNNNWGGIAGDTCNAPTQTLSLVVAAAGAGGIPTSNILGILLLIGMLAASGIGVLWRR